MAERDDERYLRLQVRLAGGLCEQIAPTVAGLPDRMVLLRGRVYLVEMKTTSGALRPVQRAWHAKALAAGVPVYTLHGREDVDLWLDLVT